MSSGATKSSADPSVPSPLSTRTQPLRVNLSNSLRIISIPLSYEPFYATSHTHTEASATGLQMSQFREEARDVIRDAVNAPSEEYAVCCCGSGSTAAIHKMAHVLGILPPSPLPTANKPVVFIGPYEHHSYELIWRESPVDVVTIPLSEETGTRY